MGRSGAYLAVGAIMLAAALSFSSLAIWCSHHFPDVVSHDHHAEHAEHEDKATGGGYEEDSETDSETGAHTDTKPQTVTHVYWELGRFGKLRLSISCYIDGLTIMMFCMVTLIATCIHFYAIGYMEEEEHDVTDHEVTLSDGSHLTRPGRYYRFFQYLSLFCFSMLGLVLAGNLAMVFVFWELVGICSYFLIGFYVERPSASTAANKAFIVNRVGDFGFIIGMVALWSTVGTLSFGDLEDGSKGLFSQLRTEENHHQLAPSREMVLASAHDEVAVEVANVVEELGPDATSEMIVDEVNSRVDEALPEWREKTGLWGAPYGYWFLIVAGLGIFCGCVGKSAQFPIHVWLPDAMEGPTPVSALVHSATMVAAGVYLVGRFFPLFTPEVLFVIASVGAITLLMAATIAITATDIKRVLAYSTISQLGYMMLALGLGGWVAGMMHLVTHAFFKSLLFMCSGSVIHAVHTNEMTEMGGLRKKMPITAYTMLVGCLAISGAGIPLILNVGLSGFYSKDKILEQAFSYMNVNGAPWGMIFFLAATGGAALTAFYMFRLWYLTFAGEPRNQERYDHAHESPAVMTAPLVVLAIFAVAVAWNPTQAMFGAVIAIVGLIALAVRLRTLGVGDSSPTHTDAHQHDDHEHEAVNVPKRVAIVGVVLLVVIAIWSSMPVTLEGILAQNRPLGTLPDTEGMMLGVLVPSEDLGHQYANYIGPLATCTAILGFAFATFMYGLNYLNPNDVRTRFPGIYTFLRNKWYFDELYDTVFVKNAHRVGRLISEFDHRVIDGLVHGLASGTKYIARQWDRLVDQGGVDRTVNLIGSLTHRLGIALRVVQTGSLRQYVMFIVIGTIAIFIVISFFWSPTFAK
jgi:NADH-quinone oxidoreductase subunit L